MLCCSYTESYSKAVLAAEETDMNPMPTVIYNDRAYKVRSRKTEIPDLDAMRHTDALFWLLRNTYPQGTNHRRPAPNLPSLTLRVR